MNASRKTNERPGTRIKGDGIDFFGPGPEVLSSASMRGDKVVNRLDEDLGEIADIMIDVESGRVAYAVLSFGGVLGVGDKLFAIPWQALTLDADRRCFILDVPREHLKEAPGFDKAQWPSMADPAWVDELRSYPTRGDDFV